VQISKRSEKHDTPWDPYYTLRIGLTLGAFKVDSHQGTQIPFGILVREKETGESPSGNVVDFAQMLNVGRVLSLAAHPNRIHLKNQYIYICSGLKNQNQYQKDRGLNDIGKGGSKQVVPLTYPSAGWTHLGMPASMSMQVFYTYV